MEKFDLANTAKAVVVVFPTNTKNDKTALRSQAEKKIKEILTLCGLPSDIDRLPSGKIVCNGNAFASVSHSEKLVAVAVACREVGVDIQVRTQANCQAIAQKFFTEQELQTFFNSESNDTFFAVWCRKEALWKSLEKQPQTIRTVETSDSNFTEQVFTFNGEKYFLAVTGEAEIFKENF